MLRNVLGQGHKLSRHMDKNLLLYQI